MQRGTFSCVWYSYILDFVMPTLKQQYKYAYQTWPQMVFSIIQVLHVYLCVCVCVCVQATGQVTGPLRYCLRCFFFYLALRHILNRRAVPLLERLAALLLRTVRAQCGGREALQMAVMKASRGVTRPRRPHSEAMVSSAFRMFSVAVSSVLKRQDRSERKTEEMKNVV